MKKDSKNQILLAGLAGLLAVTALPALGADNNNANRRNQIISRDASPQLERLNRIIGAEVISSDRQKVGTLNNVVLDLESGHVLFAVVSTDNGRVALPPGVISDARGNSVYLKLPKDRVASAPKIEGQMTRENVSQASFVNRVHEHFNQPAWWKGSSSADQGKFNNVHTGENLMGLSVVNVQDQPVGVVRNAVLDLAAGRILYVVMEPRSNLNIDDKLFALPPSALTAHKDGKSLVTDTDKEKLSNAPSFPRNEWPALTDRSFASRVYQHYGKQAYFDSGTSGFGGLRSTGSESERVYDSQSSQSTSDGGFDNNYDSSSERLKLQREREALQRERERLQRAREGSQDDNRFDRYPNN